MKKITALLLLLTLFLALFASCGEESGRRYDYDLSEYVTLKQYDKIRAKYADPTVCTEEEIDRALHQILLTYAEFGEKENKVVEEYDKVMVEYAVLYDGKVMEEYSQEEYGILVGYDGTGDVDRALAREMMGKTVGDFCRASYTFPADDVSLGSWAGLTVEVTGKILNVYQSYVPECTDELVSRIGDGFESVQAFRDQLRLDIMEQKGEAKKTAVMQAFLDGVEVIRYPEAELKVYRERYLSEIRSAAQDLNIEYARYLEEYLNLTEDEASEAAQKDAEARVKNDLACIQACRLLKTTLTEQEYKEGLAGYYEVEKEEFDSVEAFEAHYTKEFMYDCILWDKTFLVMVENAVPVS